MTVVHEPKRIWWARPRKLCVMERPGGGGRSHRPDRREADIRYLKQAGVWVVVSIMPTRHNLPAYEAAGLEWRHWPLPPPEQSNLTLEEAFGDAVLGLRRLTRKRGAVALHGNRHTDLVAALAAAHLYDAKWIEPTTSLMRAVEAGLTVTREANALAGADPRYVGNDPAYADRRVA